jgi:hypothetical protein
MISHAGDSIGWTIVQGATFAATPLFELAAGLYLFFGGKRIAELAVPSNHLYCRECGYDLTATPGHVCPDCGTQRHAG